MEKHLWEVNHPLYFGSAAYHSTEEETSETFDRFHEFLRSFEQRKMKVDWVLVRWDWGIKFPHEDPYYFNGQLELFYIMYRKGLYRAINILVCHKDEEQVKKFLKEQLQELKRNWDPVWIE